MVPLPPCDTDESSSDESTDSCDEVNERTLKVRTDSKPGSIVEV